MITKYTKKDGSTAYKLQAYLGVDPMTGKQVRTTRQGFKTQAEAKRVEVKLVEEFQRQGAWRRNDQTTFDEVAELWFEQYKNTVKITTYKTTENYFKVKIKPVLGHLPLNKINVMVCQRLVNDLASNAAYSLYISIANRIFRYAIHMGIIENNPLDRTIRAKGAHIPKSEKFDNFYTKDELAQFLKIVEETEDLERLLIYRILSYGGLRVGELVALENTDFDFVNGTISVTKTLAYTNPGYVIQKPKTKRSIRIISMDKESMRLAKQYIKHFPIPLHGSFRLFNVTQNAIRARIRTTAKKHNLKVITPHGFRHTHASLLFEAGIPAKIAQERLGHAKISITLDLYTHLTKSQKDDVADKLANFIAV
ncbi:site-specific integrase [Streptococcus sp. 19428wC2_LYSM12]|uniref:site-specific integrase n=1 Tax=Streptococcus sp. 19428wC2_LYSM12 TaxID=2782470 RepID=UPI0026095A5D|nr:site-specific integrase [Streptococcus sp. 19428wC2_LYSM12]